jgi:putative hydrolase of the HAD superfamily
MIRVISFDMDGTLVNSRFVDKVWMEGLPERFAEKYGVEVEAAKDHVIGEYMKIGSDRLEWYDLQYWIDRFGLNIGKDELLDSYSDLIELYPEVREVIHRLSEEFQLVITSNAAREFVEIEMDGLCGYFERIFSATSDLRSVKKSSDVYREVCKMMNVRPIEVLHIGDHYTYDYESPLEAGLDALFLDRSGKRSGPEVVGDLREAAELVCNGLD